MQNLLDRALGKYVIIEEIGRGGMGTVYKARDVELDRIVAIKVLSPYLVGEPQLVQRFIREARMAANLDHPNIVTIYDIGGEGGYYYFVMKYLEGPTLKELLADTGPLPYDELVRIVNQLASALDFAHEQNLVHRDIKPGNVIVDEDGQITLTDFGLAKVAENLKLTASGEAIGTLEYMAPEQARGEVDKTSDIYSLGVMVYEMISGRLPFQGHNQATLLYQHLHEPPPSMRKWRPDVPPEMEEIVLKAMAKEPTERYQAAGEMARGLEEIVQKSWLAAPPPRKSSRKTPSKEDKPKRAAKEKKPHPPKAQRQLPIRPFLRRWGWTFLVGVVILALLFGGLPLYRSWQVRPTPVPIPAVVGPANAVFLPLLSKNWPPPPPLPAAITRASLAMLCQTGETTPTTYLAYWEWGQEKPQRWPGLPKGAVVHQFSWSPEGEWLVFAATTSDGQTDLYRLRFDGVGLLNLTESPEVESDPVWSPSGDTIAFSIGPEGARDIALISVDGGTPTYLVQDDADDWAPSWAPQGSRLVFVSNRDGNADLYLLDLLNKEVRPLTESPASEIHPAWSPSGQRIAFLSERDNDLVLQQIDALSREEQTISSSRAQASQPSWAPDGDWLAFTRLMGNDSPQIYFVHSSSDRVYAGPRDCDQPSWRPTP